MTPATSGQFQKKKKPSHGLTTLRRAVKELGGRAIDKRTSLGRALEDWRHSLLDDLGGIQATSTQQRQLVDLAVKTKLLLDSVDAWLLVQPSLVNARKRTVLPVLLQRQQMSDSLARLMQQLGLEKRSRPMLSLHEYLSKPTATATDTTTTNTTPSNVEPIEPPGGAASDVSPTQPKETI